MPTLPLRVASVSFSATVTITDSSSLFFTADIQSLSEDADQLQLLETLTVWDVEYILKDSSGAEISAKARS